eukprot:g11191.t1
MGCWLSEENAGTHLHPEVPGDQAAGERKVKVERGRKGASPTSPGEGRGTGGWGEDADDATLGARLNDLPALTR